MKHLYSRLTLITSITLVLGYLIVSAAWVTMTPTATSGTQFTADIWNNMVGNMNDLNARVSSLGSSLWATGATSSINYTAGNVGVGTSNPSTKLHIYGANPGGVLIEDSTSAGASVFLKTTKRQWNLSNDSSGNFQVYDNTATATRLLVSTGGNVGIGTTSPGQLLHIASSSSSAYAVISGSNNTNSILSLQSKGADGNISGPTSKGWNINVRGDSFSNAGVQNALSFDYYNLGIGTNVLHLSPLGNIGIGTTAPNKLLHLKTPTGANAELDIQSGTKPYWGIYHDETTEQLRFWNGADRIVFASGGNVGIGTASPSAKLEVNDNTLNNFAGKFIQTNNTNSNGVYIQAQTANAGDMGFGVFSSGGTTPVLIARNNGNVGIGTTTPSAKLDVSSGVDQHVLIITHQNTSSGMTIASNNDANTAHPPLELMGNPIIMMSGNVGIGVTNPQFTLDTGAGGNIRTGYLYNMGAYCYAVYPNCISSYNVYQAAAPYSDQRLKKDIKTLDGEGSLNSILKLKPINFLWKDVAKNNQEGPQLGFIAQDVEKIFPQAMLIPLKSQPKEKLEITDSDGKKEIIDDPKMVRYDRLIAPLVSAVQEFYTKWFTDSKELHNKIDIQKKEIDSLKSLVCLDHPSAEICR
ncbi:MAG: tail fiber domain-containing protein [Candidatus Gracilibacteria bacterium]|nr:tail fiber domain-containing protein [Candidatus Gracilibacteria bacterium]